ncbi:MAG: hypothetical protein GEU93_15825 [Propionibacteriales bacterium]|nr:hypothetical protein [Propionibacteriales bacterium]
MKTIALEMVPTNVEDGVERAVEEAQKVAERSRACGLANRIQHVMIPGMIAEEDDRPVEMKPKMDTLEFWEAISPELEGVRGLCTQVTAFHDTEELTKRLRELRTAGMDGIAFVGVPRTMADGEGPGVAPTDALTKFQDTVPHRGVILIPTRESETGRFNFKCESGATYAMTQLLYSDAIVDFLVKFAEETPHRPEILMSFGFVASVESRVGLIDWLIQDPGNEVVAREQEFVATLAQRSFEDRKRALVDLYKRVIDGVHDLGFPLSVHLEAPYGYSKSAFETFAEMLDYWSPR